MYQFWHFYQKVHNNLDTLDYSAALYCFVLCMEFMGLIEMFGLLMVYAKQKQPVAAKNGAAK